VATTDFTRRAGPRKHARRRRIGADDTVMSGRMLKAAVDAILRSTKLDRSHDVPYLAGYSRDGKTIYIDKDLPRSFRAGGTRVQVDRFLILHEAVEKTLLDALGLVYQHAHQIALRAEQAAVRAAGVSWREYDRFMARHIKEADDVIDRLPADLDIKPYRDERDVQLLKRMRAEAARDRTSRGATHRRSGKRR
jgi:hypothetical protein